MQSIAVVFGLLAIIAVASAGNVQFGQCTSLDQATIVTLGVSGCPDGASTCDFVKGTTYTFDIVGRAESGAPVANTLEYKVTAVFLGVPITLLEGNACDSLVSGSCPVSPGEQIAARVQYTVGDAIPAGVTVTVQVRLFINGAGSNANAVECVNFSAAVKNPSEPAQVVPAYIRRMTN